MLEEYLQEVLESLADTDGPSVGIRTLGEISPKINVIFLAQLKPSATSAARQEVLGSKRLIAAGHYPAQSSECHYAKPLG
jgi:hypothetical protein